MTNCSLRVVLAAGLALFVVAACGGPTPATSTRPSTPAGGPSAGVGATATPVSAGLPDDLCTIFTEQLAVAAIGQPVAAPTSGDVLPRPNGIYCHYAAAADPNMNAEAQLKNNQTRAEFEALAQNVSGSVPLAGVGEAAYRADHSFIGGPGASIVAWSGGRGVTVSINSDANPAQVQAAAIAIATAVLAS